VRTSADGHDPEVRVRCQPEAPSLQCARLVEFRNVTPGAVAQWSEQGTHNPSVAGSIPACPTRSSSPLGATQPRGEIATAVACALGHVRCGGALRSRLRTVDLAHMRLVTGSFGKTAHWTFDASFIISTVNSR
jgi:hypothetical protein